MTPPTPMVGRIVWFCPRCGFHHEAEGNQPWLVMQRAHAERAHAMHCSAPLGEERPT